ncbi:MAG: DUF3696 domain-containing protein [Planctomycetaceae bacterium]
MLRALELENFKAFGQRTRIEFAPITLIFGENSAGKSSILQALNLLKQTRESREHGALLLPRAENGFVDLGSFQELLFDHDMERDLAIRVDLEPDAMMNRRIRERRDESVEAEGYQGMELQFARRSEKEEIHFKSLILHCSDANGKAAVFEPAELDKEELRSLVRDSMRMMRDRRPAKISELRAARCTWLTENRELWARHFDVARERSDKLIQGLEELKLEMTSSSRQRHLFEEHEEEIGKRIAGIESAISFYASEFGLSEFVDRMRPREMEAVIALDGFAPLPVRPRNLGLPELEMFRAIGPRMRMRDIAVDVAWMAIETGRTLDYVLESLYPMGPYRRPPERWYIFTGTSPQDVGYRGDMLPDLLFRRPELVRETNDWLDRLKIGYHIKVQPVGLRSRDLFEVRLIDTRRGKKVDVALSDVGFGISQILPFVVQSLAGESQIITIEQPEVHIHPRLQADLGDLLAAAIGRPRNHRFIIETHSEHLVLRMQRLVREGKLRPEDVSVIYVSRSEKGSAAKRLHLDRDGDFVDEWPGGFFPERLNELR